jgi:hypothetical protein
MPPDTHRAAEREGQFYDDDDNPTNTINVQEIVDHWLQYQEIYRVGSIIDITEKKGTYYAIIEVTDPAAKDAFRNNDLPLFVSPAIAQLDPFEDPSNITQWTGIHLAIVSDPAYTIKKALITGQCHDEKEKCLLQLRQAAIESEKLPRIGCGFCRTGALARYAEIVKSWRTKHSVVINAPRKAKNLEEFITNSSIDFSDSHLKTELTDQQSQNNNNNNNTTTDTNKPQEFENKQQEQGGDLGEQQEQKGKEVTSKTTTTKETSNEVTKEAETVGVRVAGMEECVAIFQQNGVQPDQAAQICKLAAQALMDNQQQQQQPGQQPGQAAPARGAPKPPGQFGSVTDYEKELTKQELKIAELTEQLKNYRKDDKSDAQRIAELEDTVNKLNRNLKEKEIESYLVTKIADEKFRNDKIKRFADLNLSLDDIKDIFETAPITKGNTGGNIKKVAEIEQASPISKVKLQVASVVNEDNQAASNNSSSNVNEVKERNNRIISSLQSNKGFN